MPVETKGISAFAKRAVVRQGFLFCHTELDGWGRAVSGWWRGISVFAKRQRRSRSFINLLAEVIRLSHPLRYIEPVRVRSPRTRTELEMCATSLTGPIRSHVQQLSADTPAAMTRRHDEVLEPAARPVPNRENVRVYRGKPDNAISLYGKQDVSIAVMHRIFEPGPSSLGGVPGCAHARRLEQLLD